MWHELAVFCGPIAKSTNTQYTAVATKVPSVNCVPRSRMKLRSIRGPNWVDASVSVTIVTEKLIPITVMIAAATARRISRAVSALPRLHPRRQPEFVVVDGAVHLEEVAQNSAIAASTSMLGPPEVGPQYFAPPLRNGHP